MSVLIYAGSAQFIGIALLSSEAGYGEIASVILLLNARHMVYGLSVMDKLSEARKAKPYLIFALTDETYGLLTTSVPPPGVDHGHYYFWISVLNHSYWVTASIAGYLAGRVLPVSTEGLGFALTALFVVLFIEQWKNCKVKLPFISAAACGVAALILIGPKNMLVVSIVSAIGIVLLLKKVIELREPA
jgi:4-azaleucine resistance transporter AzlC